MSTWYLGYYYPPFFQPDPHPWRKQFEWQCQWSRYITTLYYGTVRDKNGQPIAGASVIAKGTNIGTTTDANGNFTIQMPGASNILTVSQQWAIRRKKYAASYGFANVMLKEDKQVPLNEVVVTGYGTSGDEGGLLFTRKKAIKKEKKKQQSIRYHGLSAYNHHF